MTDRETELKEELGKALRRANELDALLAERDDEVYRHEGHIEDLIDARVRDREAREEQDSHIAYLESLIETKSNRIEELKAEVRTLTDACDEGEDQYRELQMEFSQYILDNERSKEIRELRDRIHSYELGRQKLSDEIDSSEAQVEKLTAANDSLKLEIEEMRARSIF